MSGSHFEVVDTDSRIVGSIKQATADQARTLRRALLDGGYNGQLAVALVTERVIVQRDVVLLAVDAPA